ncbi:class I SAM-dependent methyltransferase [Hoeflea sp.]|uniref:class I SAM-dependent methyltransferase n=1 Tax=Hoeflea sp. TaxID=1940281 RepID=UPI003A8D2379
MEIDLSELKQSQRQEIHRDRIARVYLGEVSDGETQRRAQSRVDWMVDQAVGERVYDVGCSEGICAVLLAKRGFFVEAIDINPEVIDFAGDLQKKMVPEASENIEFRVEDIFALDKIDARFDTVILGEVIEHVYEPHKLLLRACLALKTGGRMIVTTPWGYFPAPDHHQTFVLSSFIDVLPKEVRMDSLEVVDGYIRFSGTKVDVSSKGGAAAEIVESCADVRALLNKTEAAALESQEFLRGVLDQRNDLLTQARAAADEIRSKKDHAIGLLQEKLAARQQVIDDLKIRLAKAVIDRDGETKM